MQKEEKLEEFRSFGTSKRRKQRVNKEVHKEATKEKMLKRRISYVRKSQMGNKALSLQLQLKRKHLVEF